jgi:hypothetical protein
LSTWKLQDLIKETMSELIRLFAILPNWDAVTVIRWIHVIHERPLLYPLMFRPIA